MRRSRFVHIEWEPRLIYRKGSLCDHGWHGTASPEYSRRKAARKVFPAGDQNIPTGRSPESISGGQWPKNMDGRLSIKSTSHVELTTNSTSHVELSMNSTSHVELSIVSKFNITC